MSKYRILFADLDGTVISTITKNTFPKGILDMYLRFTVLDKIKELNPEYIFIVSNQGGIDRGFVDETSFNIKIRHIVNCIREYCNIKCDFQYCPIDDKDNKFRKPNTGMLHLLAATYFTESYDNLKSEMLMIGDASGKPGQFSDSDKKTAENFGIDYLDVEDFLHETFEHDKYIQHFCND